jgi:hypothetical protein
VNFELLVRHVMTAENGCADGVIDKTCLTAASGLEASGGFADGRHMFLELFAVRTDRL